ncbi:MULTISPECIES: hypothetical protein [unclassified Chryseobacterium]|uniref:hypothetical protein n=1 Tax=unclassified Chryseobacterium TaxID=2593645 RepID=UPI000D437B04|nr:MULTISPECIES: hypothetical protein [unclassified Chryseobacterium]PTT72323.1 hypothetical protein DBR25_14825 [Chryseobacterium sp. HMWF001]PVV54762.1 hypothetical protein DD829_17410 [Chryseobacterium sp. HMWF035]
MAGTKPKTQPNHNRSGLNYDRFRAEYAGFITRVLLKRAISITKSGVSITKTGKHQYYNRFGVHENT